MPQPVIVVDAELLIGVPVVGYADGRNVGVLHAYSVLGSDVALQGEGFAVNDNLKCQFRKNLEGCDKLARIKNLTIKL